MHMQEQLEAALRGVVADYCEIRVEDATSTHIGYRMRELESIGTTRALGGNVRAVVRGGWGFVSFNELDGLEEKVAMAVRQARLAAQDETALAPAEPVVEIVPAEVTVDAATVSLSEKKALMDEYVEAALTVSDKIQTSQIYYSDARRTVRFVSSAGSYIEQDRMIVRAGGIISAREGGEIQTGRTSRSSTKDFDAVRGLHEEFAGAARQAVDLLEAEPARSGEFVVVMDPSLAGVFIHEAFGHLSEADHVDENPHLRELLEMGKEFGPPILNVTDSAAEPGLSGSYRYDSEGVASRKNYLIREGRLSGRLHSRETAGRMGEEPTGNARAISYRYPPIVRMTNTAIEAGETSFEEMIADVDEGVYAVNWLGGQTAMEMFTFRAMDGFMIRKGKLAERLRGVTLTGNVFETLKAVDAVGNDFQWDAGGGGCGKAGQSPLPVGNGAPHVRLARCVIGGG